MTNRVNGAIIFFLLLTFACASKKQKEEIVYVEEETIDQSIFADIGKLKLSDYGFFTEPIAKLHPAENVFPYELNSPLFTDYSLKKRFIFIPKDKKINYHEKEVLQFPVGTILIKNFHYEESQLAGQKSRIIETRLLVHEEDGWRALPYVWNDEQTDAFLEITGGEQKVALRNHGEFMYSIPNMAQCKSCHELNGAIAPIGPSARQLNKTIKGKNQLASLTEAGVLDNLPEISEISQLPVWNESETGTLDERARAYLEINCGHCHRPEGPAKNSGLDLTIFSASDHSLGIFKGPVAAGAGSGGHSYDIVPGKPEESILTYRMESNDPGIMMPELGRRLIHTEGVELIKSWINNMK